MCYLPKNNFEIDVDLNTITDLPVFFCKLKPQTSAFLFQFEMAKFDALNSISFNSGFNHNLTCTI